MTTKKTPAAKTRSRAAKSVSKPKATAAEPVKPPADLLRKKELVERVVKRSGVKKKDAKPVIEVLLAELGEALAAGRGCALPPLGRLVVNREKELEDGRVIIVKVRQKALPEPDAGD